MDRRDFIRQAGVLAAAAALPVGLLGKKSKVFEKETTLTITWLPGLSPIVTKERLFLAFPEWPNGDRGTIGIRRGGSSDCPYEWNFPVLDASKAALWGSAESVLEAVSARERYLLASIRLQADRSRFSLVMEQPNSAGKIDVATFSVPMADIDALFRHEDIPKEYKVRA